MQWTPLLLARKHRDIMHLATVVSMCQRDMFQIGESYRGEEYDWKVLQYALENMEEEVKSLLDDMKTTTPMAGESQVKDSSFKGVY
jgi:arginine deiminase